tara:strand:- start:49 stop:639 length:591 start_codon:yes stop_codon:yes gene_type:complete
MKKIIALSILGLVLAGCQTTTPYQQSPFLGDPTPELKIELSDTKNSVWETSVTNDKFDGKTIYAQVGNQFSTSGALIVRYTESKKLSGWNNGIEWYYINGDSYICSQYGYDSSITVDMIIDGKRYQREGGLSTDKTAIFLYTGGGKGIIGVNRQDWLTLLAKGKSITLRTHDGCGHQSENTFDITGWPKEIFDVQS